MSSYQHQQQNAYYNGSSQQLPPRTQWLNDRHIPPRAPIADDRDIISRPGGEVAISQRFLKRTYLPQPGEVRRGSTPDISDLPMPSSSSSSIRTASPARVRPLSSAPHRSPVSVNAINSMMMNAPLYATPPMVRPPSSKRAPASIPSPLDPAHLPRPLIKRDGALAADHHLYIPSFSPSVSIDPHLRSPSPSLITGSPLPAVSFHHSHLPSPSFHPVTPSSSSSSAASSLARAASSPSPTAAATATASSSHQYSPLGMHHMNSSNNNNGVSFPLPLLPVAPSSSSLLLFPHAASSPHGHMSSGHGIPLPNGSPHGISHMSPYPPSHPPAGSPHGYHAGHNGHNGGMPPTTASSPPHNMVHGAPPPFGPHPSSYARRGPIGAIGTGGHLNNDEIAWERERHQLVTNWLEWAKNRPGVRPAALSPHGASTLATDSGHGSDDRESNMAPSDANGGHNGGSSGNGRMADASHWSMYGTPEQTFDIKGNPIRASSLSHGDANGVQHDAWMATINGRPNGGNNITINIASPGTVKRSRGGRSSNHANHEDDDDHNDGTDASQSQAAARGRAGRRTRSHHMMTTDGSHHNSGSDVTSGDDHSSAPNSGRSTTRSNNRARTALEIARRTNGGHGNTNNNGSNRSAPASTSTSPTRGTGSNRSISNTNPGSHTRSTHGRHRSADNKDNDPSLQYDNNSNNNRSDDNAAPRGLSVITTSGNSGDGMLPSRVPFSIVSPIPERGKKLAATSASDTNKSADNSSSRRRLRSRSASRTRTNTKKNKAGGSNGEQHDHDNDDGNGSDGTGDEYDANGRLLPRQLPPNPLYIGRRRNSDDMHREHPSLPPYLTDVRWDGEMYHSVPKKKKKQSSGNINDENDDAIAHRNRSRAKADEKRSEFIAEYTKRLRALKGNTNNSGAAAGDRHGDDDEETKQLIQAEVDKWQAAQDDAERRAKKTVRHAATPGNNDDGIDDEVDNDDDNHIDDDDHDNDYDGSDHDDDDDDDVSARRRRRRMQRQRSADTTALPLSTTILAAHRSAPPVLNSKTKKDSRATDRSSRSGASGNDDNDANDNDSNNNGVDRVTAAATGDAHAKSRAQRRARASDERISLHRNPYTGGFDREDHENGQAVANSSGNRSLRGSPEAANRSIVRDSHGNEIGRRQEPFFAISKSPTSRPATATAAVASSSSMPSFDPSSSSSSSPPSSSSHNRHDYDVPDDASASIPANDGHLHGHHHSNSNGGHHAPIIPLSNGELLLSKQPKTNFGSVGVRTAQPAYHPDFTAHWTPPPDPPPKLPSPIPPPSLLSPNPIAGNTGSSAHSGKIGAHAHFADDPSVGGKNRATKSLQGSPATSPDGPTYNLLAAHGGTLHGMDDIIIRDEDDSHGTDDGDTLDGISRNNKAKMIRGPRDGIITTDGLSSHSNNSSRGAPSTTPGTAIGDRPAIWPPVHPSSHNGGLPNDTNDSDDQLIAAVMAYLKRPECVLLPHTTDGTGVLIGGTDSNGDALLLNGDSARLLIEDGQTGGLTLHYLQHLQDQQRNFDSLENLVVALSEMVGTLQEKNDVFSKLNNPYSTLLDPSVTFNMSDVDRLFFESKAGPDTLVHLDDMIREGRRFDTFDALVEAVQSQQMDAFQRRKVLVEFLTSQNEAGAAPLNESDLDQLYDEGRELSAALRQLAQGEHEKALLQYLRHPTTNLLTPVVEENLTITDMRQFFGPGLPGEHTLKYLKDLAKDRVTYRTFPDLVAAVKNAHRDHNDKLKKAKASVWTYLTDPKPGSLFGRHQQAVQPTITHTQVDALFDKGGAGLDTFKTLRLLKRARRMGSGHGQRHGAATPGGGAPDENGFRSMAELTAAVRAVTAIEQERQRVFQFLTSPQCKLFEVPPPLSVRTDSSLFLSDSGTSGAMGSHTIGSSHHSPVSTTRLLTDGTSDTKRDASLLHTPQSRHPLGSSGTLPHTPAGTHHLYLSPGLTSSIPPSSPLTPSTPSPDAKSITSSSNGNEESDVLGALRDKENMEIIAKQIREQFGPRLAQSSLSSRDSSRGGTAASSRRPSQNRSATLMGTTSPGSHKSTISSRSPGGLHVATPSSGGRFASFNGGERKGAHARSPSASPPLSPHPSQPLVVRMEHVENLFAELAADQHQRITDGTTRADRGPVYPHVYGWLNDFNDASRKFARFPDLIRALKDRAAGMDDSECEVAPHQTGPLERSSSNLETLMEGGVNVMPTLVKVLEEIIEPNDENDNHDDDDDESHNAHTTPGGGNGGGHADGSQPLTVEDKARHDAEQQADQMDEETKTLAHLQLLAPELFITPAKITIDTPSVSQVIAASGGLPHAARFYLSQLAASCTSSLAAKAAGRPLEDDQPQFQSMDQLIEAISDAHDAAKAVKNEMFDFLTAGAGSGLVTQTFGVVPRLPDMDRLYEDGAAGNDTLVALQTLADAGLEFGFLGELGAAIKAAHVGAQRQQAADKAAMMTFFKERGGQALLPSLPPVTTVDIDTLYRDGDAGSDTVERMEPLLAASRTFDTITALADAIRNPDVDARRAQVEAQAAQHERDKKEVVDYLQGPDCQLFMDAPDKVNIGVRDVDALFYEGGAAGSTITFVKAFDFADKRFERFPQLIAAVAAAHRGKRVKQQQQQNKKAGGNNDGNMRTPTLVVGDSSLSVLPAIVAALQERTQQALGRPRKFGRTHSLGEDDGVTGVTQLPGYEKNNGPNAGGGNDNHTGVSSLHVKDHSPGIPGLDRTKSHRRTQSSIPVTATTPSRPVSPTLRALATAAAAAAANVPSPIKNDANAASGANASSPVAPSSSSSNDTLNTTASPSAANTAGLPLLPLPLVTRSSTGSAGGTIIDGSPSSTTRQLRRPPALDVSNNHTPSNHNNMGTPTTGKSPRTLARGSMTPRSGGSQTQRDSLNAATLGAPQVSGSPSAAKHSRSIGRWQGLSRPVVSSSAQKDEAEADMHVAAASPGATSRPFDDTATSTDGLRPKSSGVRRGSTITMDRPESAAADNTEPSLQRRGSSVAGSRGTGVSFAPDTPLSRPSRGLIRARTRSLAMNSLDPNAGNVPTTPGHGAHARRLDAAAAAYAASVASTTGGLVNTSIEGNMNNGNSGSVGAVTNDTPSVARVNSAHAALMQAANSSATSSTLASLSSDTAKAGTSSSLASTAISSSSSSSSHSSSAAAASSISSPSGPSRSAPSTPAVTASGTTASSLSVSSGVTMTTPQTGLSSSIADASASSSTASVSSLASSNTTANGVIDPTIMVTTGNNQVPSSTGGIKDATNRGPSNRPPAAPSTTTVIGASSAGSVTSDNAGAIISHGTIVTASSSTIVTPQPVKPATIVASTSVAAAATTTTHRGPAAAAPSPPPDTLITMSTGVAPSIAIAQHGTVITPRKPMPPVAAKTGEEKKRPVATRPVTGTSSARRWALLKKHVRGGQYRKKRPQPPAVARQEVLEPQLEPTFKSADNKDNGTYENDPDKEFVHFNIECDNIDKVNILTSTDSCVRISCSRQHIWELVHQTPMIRDSVNPRWPSLILPVNRICYGEYERALKIEVVHMYNDGTPPKFLARLETTLKMMILSKGKPFDLINADKQRSVRGYVNSGTIRFNDPGIWINTTMTIIKSVSSRLFDTESQCFLRLKIKAEGLPKRNILSTPDPFLQFYRLRKGKELRAREAKDRKEEKEVDERWELMHSTDAISSSLNPQWDLIIKVHTLSFGEYNRPVLIQMMDKSGRDGRLIGSFEVTIKSLCAKQSKELYPLIHHDKKKKDGAKYNHSGVVTCQSAMVFTRAYKRKEVVDRHGRHAVLTSNPLGLRKTVIGYMKALAQEHEKRGRVAPIATGAQTHLSDLHFSSLAEKAMLVDRTGILNSRANSRPGSRANSRPSSPSRDQQGRVTPTGLMSVSSFGGGGGGVTNNDTRSHRGQQSMSMARYPSGTTLVGNGDMTTRSARHSRDVSVTTGALQPQPPSSSRRHRDRDDNRSAMTPISATFSGSGIVTTPAAAAGNSSGAPASSSRRQRRATGERASIATSPSGIMSDTFSRTSSAI